MGAAIERLKVISCWEDGRRKRIPVSRCQGDKRIGTRVCSVRIQFKRVGVLNLRKSRIKPLEELLIISRQNKSHDNICKTRDRAETDFMLRK